MSREGSYSIFLDHAVRPDSERGTAGPEIGLTLKGVLLRSAPCLSAEMRTDEVARGASKYTHKRDAAANAGWALLLHSHAIGPARLRSPLDERISLMPEVEIDYMEKHPPSCVGANVASAPTELRNLIRRDYGGHTTVFALRCLCGGDHFGVSLPDDGFGTVSIKCVSCGSQRIVFDPLKHGYDGALGLNQGVGMGPSAAGACPKCKLGTFQLATGFQYSGETDILEQKKLDIKPEDLFDSFVLGGRCTSCGESSILIDLECA